MRSLINYSPTAIRASSLTGLTRRATGLHVSRFQRQYATTPPEEETRRGPGGEIQGTTSNLPLIAIVGLVAMIPLYYFSQATLGTGDKAVGSGQAAIKESRRAGNASNEYRDPRDTGRKTSSVDGPGK